MCLVRIVCFKSTACTRLTVSVNRGVRPTLAIPIVLLITTGLIFPAAQASSVSSPYSITIGGGTVSASIILDIFQNLTIFENSFTLPQFQGVLEGANSTAVAQAVQGALQVSDSQARADNVRLQAVSGPWSALNGRQWLNISLDLNVGGVISSSGEASRVDMSWKSFAVPSGIVLGANEANRLGEAYLFNVATTLVAESPPTSTSSIFFSVNGLEIPSSDFPAAVRDWSVLDFSRLATPVSTWKTIPSPLTNTNIWSSTALSLGVRVLSQIQEPGQGVGRTSYGLFYDLNAVIIAPSRSSVTGNTFTFTTGSSLEIVMTGIILSTLILWSGTFVYERRLPGMVPGRRSKR